MIRVLSIVFRMRRAIMIRHLILLTIAFLALWHCKGFENMSAGDKTNSSASQKIFTHSSLSLGVQGLRGNLRSSRHLDVHERNTHSRLSRSDDTMTISHFSTRLSHSNTRDLTILELPGKDNHDVHVFEARGQVNGQYMEMIDNTVKFDPDHDNLKGDNIKTPLDGVITVDTDSHNKTKVTTDREGQSQRKRARNMMTRHSGTTGRRLDEAKELESSLKRLPLRSENYTFPHWSECFAIKERADSLPDMIFVPFEESVSDIVLGGWEDDWVANAQYVGPKLEEPKIDFVYNWVNGSQPELQATMLPYEINSSLNDVKGIWMATHGTNRYREWDELRYSIRSVERYANSFMNRIQILVNAFHHSSHDGQTMVMGKQKPQWLNEGLEKLQVLSQEEFFGPDERKCLPSFDSLTIENQLYNTQSETDRLFALSDDMILGKLHSAADIYSPLFGPTMGFKDNAYNTLKPPTEADAERFGEKPFLIYTSWLLNRRFGARKRKGQVHFGHSLSRSIAKEAITSFPRPALRSAVQRFRGETGFQLYSWYVMFHYTMERHREALLYSYIMLRSDQNDDGYLDWKERSEILRELAEGMENQSPEQYRRRIYYRVADHLEEAGLEPPKVNTDILWTSMDGPAMIKTLGCDTFDTEDCLGPGFSESSSDSAARSPVFSSAVIFDRVARQSTLCGDCLIKIILNRKRSGLSPMLPHGLRKSHQRTIIVKALMKYQYTIVAPDAAFHMITDSEQAEHSLLRPYIKHHKKIGQICLNDDVVTQDEIELEKLRKVMTALFEGLLPEPSSFEK